MHESHRRRGAASVLLGALVTTFVTVVAAAPTAQSLTPGVAFSATASSTWQTNGVVYALAASRGKVVAGGEFTAVRPPTGGSGATQSISSLAVFDAATGAPDSCQLPVTWPSGSPTVRALTPSPDGSVVYVGGNFATIGGVDVGRLAAIDVVSCRVTAFRPPPISSIVRTIATSGNKVFFGGDFTTVDGQTRQRFAAVDSSGRLLPWAPQADAPGRGIGVSPDGGKVAIGGDFFNVNGAATHSIAVVDGSTGANLRTYSNGFIPDTSVTKHIFSGQDRFYISNEGTGGGVFDGRAAFSWDTLDQVWRDTCLGATQASLEYGGTLYSASHAHDCSANGFQDGKRSYLMAQDATTSDLLGWDPKANDGTGERIGPRALATAPASDGETYLWVGGEFTQINGVAQQGLTRFSTGTNTTPPTPGLQVEATVEGTVQVRWRAVVDPDDSELTYSVYRNEEPTPVWQGSASSVWWKRPQVSFVDTDVVPGRWYTYRVTASDGTSTSPLSGLTAAQVRTPAPGYAATVRADRPTLYWNSRTTADWVQDAGAVQPDTRRLNGIIASGTAASSDSPVAGDPTGSLSFDGSDDYVWSDEYVAGPQTYSVETWIKTSTTRGGSILGYGNGRPRTDNGARQASSSDRYDRVLYMDNSGIVRFGAGVGSSGRRTLASTRALNDGRWHHLVGTQGPRGMALYVDGVRVGTNASTTAGTYKGVWHLGGDSLSNWPSAPSSAFFGGLVDETAVYPTALDRAAVVAHYRAAGGTVTTNPRPTGAYAGAVFDDDPEIYWRAGESSGSVATDSSYFGTNPGTYESGATLRATGAVPGDTAVTTRGSSGGGFYETAATAPPTSFTSEAWVKTTSTSGGKIIGFDASRTGNSGTTDKNLYMTSNGRIAFGTNAGSIATVVSTASYNDGQWHHVAATLDSSGQKLYVDGALVGSRSTNTAGTSSGYWRVGGGNLSGWTSQPSSSYLNATIDEVAIYYYALSAQQVARHRALGIADTTAPSVPGGLVANRANGVATLSWSPSTDNVGLDGYRVYRGLTPGFMPDAAILVTTTSATTFSEPLTAGTYYYRVVAVDLVGNASAASAAAQVVLPDTVAPTTPSTVSATVSGPGAVTVTWGASSDNVAVTGYAVYRGSTADFAVGTATFVGQTGPTATFGDTDVPQGTRYYKVVALDAAGNRSNVSTAASVTVPDSSAPTAPTALTATAGSGSVSLAWQAATDDVGVTGYRVYRTSTSPAVVAPANLVGTATTTTYVDGPPSDGTWYYTVVAVDGAGNAGPAAPTASATFSGPDVAAPSQVGSVSAAVDGATVTLTWAAATDNVGVTGYEVFRGTSATFATNAASRIGTTPERSFVDAGRPLGTSFYKVRALDAAGNAGLSSAPASATVESVAVALAPTADARATSNLPTLSTGTEDQLAARGGSVPQESFLDFAIPASPPGMTLSGAELALTTSNDGAAGSVDPFDVQVVTGSWNEATLNWDNRPTGPGPSFGTLTGATALNSTYVATGAPAALAGLTGTTVTLRVAGRSAGGDNLRLYSREGPSVYRPVLRLTWTPTP
jgi:large repetitive protein